MKRQTEQTAPTTQTPATTLAVDPADLAFEAEIVQRNASRRPRDIRRFDFPSSIDEARTIYLAVATGKDELRAAEMAEATMTDLERKSMRLSIMAEQREGIRLSIVGLVTVDDNGNILRRHIDQAAPLMELDQWSSKAWTAIRAAFEEINGIPRDELGNSVRGVRSLAAPATTPRDR